jgi:hypothetical protein
MTDVRNSWKGILQSTIIDSELPYDVNSVGCAQGSSDCFAALRHRSTGELKNIAVSFDAWPFPDLVNTSIIQQLA